MGGPSRSPRTAPPRRCRGWGCSRGRTRSPRRTAAETLVIGQEDGPVDGSQPWVYVGTKQRFGRPGHTGGLTNGLSFVLDAVNPAVSNDADWRAISARASRLPSHLPTCRGASPARSRTDRQVLGLSLDRIEDGHWDPQHRNDFYFVTTEGSHESKAPVSTRATAAASGDSVSTDIERPACRATLTLLLDGTEPRPHEPKFNKPDNMAIDRTATSSSRRTRAGTTTSPGSSPTGSVTGPRRRCPVRARSSGRGRPRPGAPDD